LDSDEDSTLPLEEPKMSKPKPRTSRKLSSSRINDTFLLDKDIECNIPIGDKVEKCEEDPPALMHSDLLKIPMQVRFGISGTLSNLIFMVAYNVAVPRLDSYMAASTIYSIVYLFLIPISHALNNLLVFGWPNKYIKSLLANTPIGISAILIGAFCTAYLDRIRFEAMADKFVRQTFLRHHEPTEEKELGEFYSSLAIMAVTGVWSYIISVVVNSPTEPPHQKKL